MSIPSLKKRKEMLVEAILAAEQRHGCKYEENGQPVCVIGQLMSICGIDLNGMSKEIISHFLHYDPKVESLRVFTGTVLNDIQAIWDGRITDVFSIPKFNSVGMDEVRRNSGSEDDTRMLMLFMVEAWDGA